MSSSSPPCRPLRSPLRMCSISLCIADRLKPFWQMKIANKIRTGGCLVRSFRQEFWQIFCPWIWNLRLEFGQQASAQVMRLTELTYSQVSAPPTDSDPPPDETPFSGETPRPSGDALASYGPPQWARPSSALGFAGA